MKLHKYIHTQPVLLLLECTLAAQSVSYNHLYDVDNFQPIQYVDFDLLSGKNETISISSISTQLDSWINPKCLQYRCGVTYK